ncbi:class V lanthionine synthetase subunit LxmK [Streptomyces osmaniensis]|uniref:Aminoglycoside phosphotransferase domain-containing protein n=1 Tax=Streptomyces osmaniensis TaxID=593134 RepID=A0ABP6Z0C3_9ACTN|nr:class IV lanthionine synthetase subunit LxmK [Streptomyces sp. JCM17656]
MAADSETTPSDPRAVPEVGAVMERHGLGSLASGAVTFPGRNDNWAGVTSTGVWVFVKKIDGPGAAGRFGRSLSFTRLPPADAAVDSPSCIAFDEASHVLVFELLEGAVSGGNLERQKLFTPAMARDAGRVVGRLHHMPVVDGTLDTTAYAWPPLDGLKALTMGEFAVCSGAQLELFGLLQKDAPLVRSVANLAAVSQKAALTPAHCDLRLDQFLVRHERLYLCDWEELRVEDPARDVGAFVGEWVHRCVHAIALKGPATDETIISSGVQALENRRPFLLAFWRGYQEAGEVTDPGLVSRATAFAGWHLLDRIRATNADRARLRALDRAGIGIARRLLYAPDLFCGILGLSSSQKGAS